MAMREWGQALAGIPMDKIRDAIDHFRDNSSMPPSIAAMRQWCSSKPKIVFWGVGHPAYDLLHDYDLLQGKG